jgi:hypothetical protein
MPHTKQRFAAVLPVLSGLAVLGALVGAGWTVRASARQNSPRSSQRSAPPNATSPGSPATLQKGQTDKPPITTDSAPSAAPSGGKQKWADIVMYDITLNQKNVERKIKLAVITGNVVIVLKPKEEEPKGPTVKVASDDGQDNKEKLRKDRNRGGTITCDQVDDYYKKEFAILKGHLVFKQQITKENGDKVDRTLTSDHAEYDGKANKMHLFAPVKFHDSDGQEIEFEKDVYVGTKEGEETLDSKGVTKGHVPIKDEEGESEKKQPEKKSGPPVKPPN